MLGSMLICITSFLVIGIFTKNNGEKGFYYSQGLMERAEAFIFFMLMIIFPAAFRILAIVFTFLLLVTAAWRIWATRQEFL